MNGYSPLHMWCFYSGEEEHSTPHDAIALPHAKSNPGVCSIGGGQDILVGLAAAETGGGDGPRITSVCHCSSRVSKRGLVFSACLAEACGFAKVDSVLGRGAVILGKCRRCSARGWLPART